MKPGDVIVYARTRRKPAEDPATYNFAGMILDIVPDTMGGEPLAKIFWSDHLTTDLIPMSMLHHFYEVIHETW